MSTESGFVFGPAVVEALTSVARNGPNKPAHVCIGITTGFAAFQVYVSPTGRSVRVFRDGKEWVPGWMVRGR